METLEFSLKVYIKRGKIQNGFEDMSIWNYCSSPSLPQHLSIVLWCLSDIRAQEDLQLSDCRTDKPLIYLIFTPPQFEHSVLTKCQIMTRSSSHYSLISSA